MVTVTPFMGKLKVHIRQFYLSEKGEKKSGTLELEEFEQWLGLFHKSKRVLQGISCETLEFTEVQFELDLTVLDLDMVFLPTLLWRMIWMI